MIRELGKCSDYWGLGFRGLTEYVSRNLLAGLRVLGCGFGVSQFQQVVRGLWVILLDPYLPLSPKP